MLNKMAVKKRRKAISVKRLLLYFVMYKILTPKEAEHALKTLELPDSIMERLKLADKISKN